MRDLAEAGSPPQHALLAASAGTGGALADRVIVPWGIQDPGNLGAILRSAAAFGFQEALLGPLCADPFSPKALRGSMGAAFLMPLRRAEALVPGRRALAALDGGPGALPLADADLGARCGSWWATKATAGRGRSCPPEWSGWPSPPSGWKASTRRWPRASPASRRAQGRAVARPRAAGGPGTC